VSFLTNLNLGKKITLLTALGLILGVAVFSSLGMRAVNRATETMLQERLTTAHLLAGYTDEILGQALDELVQTALIMEGGLTAEEVSLRMQSLLDAYSRMSLHVNNIYLLGGDGRVIWGQTWVPEIQEIDLLAFAGMTAVAEKGEPCVSGLVSLPPSGTPEIMLAAPVGEGTSGGVLAVAIDLTRSSIGGFIQPVRLGATGYVEIVDQNGIVVARTEPGPRLAPFEQSDHSGRFAALIADGQPTRGVCHTCHEAQQTVEKRDVLAFVPLSAAPWGVIVRQSEDEALASTRELRQNLLLFGGGLVTVALLFVLVTTRDVGSRIRLLTSASRKIADGDLVSRVAVLGRDEVGVLAQTLDEMRRKLKSSYGELEQKTKELSSLLSVSQIITSTADLRGLLDAVVARVVEIIPGAEAGVALLPDAEKGGLTVQHAVGLDSASLSGFIFVPGYDESPEMPSESGCLAEACRSAFLGSENLHNTVRSNISAEIFNHSRYAGSLIMLGFREGNAFSDSDKRLLRAIADYVGIAIERVQLTREAEEARALYEADRLRSEFISSVSHELRTPLTLIKGYSTSLLRQNVRWDQEVQREFLQIIDEKTDELRELIDKLLQSAKLEAGALKLEKEPVLLPHLGRKVIEDMVTRAGKRRMVMRFAPHFPVVEADSRCVEQALRNLVENAIKYSAPDGEIIIAGEVKDSEVVVSVSDNGEGIPREHRERLFERFYRVDTLLTRTSSGSGLGLSIVKGHVEAHGGRVWLESRAGKGSTFFFSLPLDMIDDA